MKATRVSCSLFIPGISGVPTISEWLLEEVTGTETVGADPQMLSYGMFDMNGLHTHAHLWWITSTKWNGEDCELHA